MGVRNGDEYKARLKRERREVWYDGVRVDDVTTHPAFSGVVETISEYYDRQCDTEWRGLLCYQDPHTHEDFGLSFLMPKTLDELTRRGNAFYEIARVSCGMLGRSPDFMNSNLSAWAAASTAFGRGKADFQANVENYYRYVRDNDLALTHSVVNMKRSKSGGGSEEVGLRVVRETESGIFVSGSRLMATLGPICDELVIYPGRLAQAPKDSKNEAIAFAIPVGTPGLRMLCREKFSVGYKAFEHPLSSRYEEIDATLFFDDVFVPWERVFIYGNVELHNALHATTGSLASAAQQTTARAIAKSEFMLGATLLGMETYGASEMPGIQQLAAQTMIDLETLKSLRRASELGACQDRWGIMVPDPMPLEVARLVFIKAFPNMIETLKLVGASNLMILSSENDLDGPLAPILEKYLSTESSTAKERVGVNRLLWDATCSSFAGREELYERFYSGGHAPGLQFLFKLFDGKTKNELMRYVRGAIKQPRKEQGDRKSRSPKKESA